MADPDAKIVMVRNAGDQYRRLVIADRGSYQRATLYDGNGLIGEFGYSEDDTGIYDCWKLRGEMMTVKELREAGL